VQIEQYIIGHRGSAGTAPENTLKAFKIGCESNASAVECDLNLTSDGRMVAIHDTTLERTTNGIGAVHNFSIKQLKELNAGEGEQIPEISEVVALVLNFGKKLIIEIKGSSNKEADIIAEKVSDLITSQHAEKIISVCSFKHSALILKLCTAPMPFVVRSRVVS
jgi:glycerophosphoryl diester phosphodiesterase